jgi:hypothetical protein
MSLPDNSVFEEYWEYGVLIEHKKVFDGGKDTQPTHTEILTASMMKMN